MKRRRVAFLFLMSVGLLAVGGYVVLLYTGASRSLVETVLSEFIRSPFGVRDAEVDPTTGRVRVDGIHIEHPTLDETDILVAEHIELSVNTNPLSSESVGAIRSVHIEKLHLNISLTEQEQWDLFEILHIPEPSGNSSSSYPAVTVANSTVSLRISSDRPAIDFRDVNLRLLPWSEDPDQMVLSGSMTTPSGFEVTIDGTGRPGDGEFRALLETVDLPLAPKIARPYSDEAERYLMSANLSGTAKRVALWMQYPAEPESEAEVSARLTMDLEGTGWQPPEFPYAIENASGRVTVSTRRNGEVHFDVLAQKGEQSLHTVGELTELLTGAPLADIRIEANSIPVDDELGTALDAIREARDAWAAFQPSGGRANATINLANQEPGGRLLASVDLRPEGVAARFVGFPTSPDQRQIRFPYLLENLSGRIQIRPGLVALDDIRGSRPDGATFEVGGRLTEFDERGPQRIAIDVNGTNAMFSDELRGALDELIENGADTYDTYSPAGRADTRLTLRREPGNPETMFVLDLMPRGCSASYRAFPYLLHGLTGNIQITNAGASFDLTGDKGGTEVDVGGRFRFDRAAEGLQSELWLSSQTVPLDPELRGAMYTMSPDLDWFWTAFEPAGTVDCKLTMWQAAGDDAFQHDLRLDFRQGSALIPRFQRPIHNLRGSVFVHGSGAENRLDISVLRGNLDNLGDLPPARVALEGWAETERRANDLDLTTVVRGLELNHALASTLDAAEIVSRETWDVLAPSGVVDVAARHRKPPAEEEVQHLLRVQLRDVSSHAEFLPQPATKLRGEVRVIDDRGDFQEIRGKLGPAVVTAENGYFEHRDTESVVDFTLTAQDLPVDSRFSRLLTGPMREAFEQRQVRGTINIPSLRMTYAFPDEGEDFELQLDGRTQARNLSMNLVSPIREINGVFEFRDGKVTPEGGSVICQAERVTMATMGHRATNFQGEFRATPDEIVLSDMSFDLHDGKVRSSGIDGRAMRFDLHDDDFAADIRWDEMSLTKFMRASGQPSPISRGTVSGDLALELPGSDLLDLTAQSTIEIRNGRLGAVPIFTAIYAFLTPGKRPQFDGGRFRINVADLRISIDELVLTSPLIEVTGSGSVGPDGYMDIVLEFPNFFGTAGDWLILPQLMRALTSQVVRFHLYGYLRWPKARPRWLFQSTPGRRDIEPIPAHTPQPTPKRF